MFSNSHDMDPPLKISLDLRYRTESGGSTYVKQLTRHLLKLDNYNKYVLIKYKDQHFGFESRAADVIIVPRLPVFFDLLWTNLVLPFLLKQRGVTVHHSLKWPLPVWNTAVNVNTMHIPHHSENGDNPMSFGMRAFFLLYGDHTITRVAASVAVSIFLKKVLVEHHKVNTKKIHVIYHGIDPSFRPLLPEQVAPVLTRFALAPGYILCVGNVTRIKNHITVVRALAGMPHELRPPLVIVGATEHRNSDYKNVTTTAKQLGVADVVTCLGFQPAENIVALLNGASVMVMPSLQEGFGLALVEAFSCGTPVISTAVGPLRELATGRALILDNPQDHRALATLLREVLSSATLRNDLRCKGLEFAQTLTWDKSAQAHINVYKHCGYKHRQPSLDRKAKQWMRQSSS